MHIRMCADPTLARAAQSSQATSTNRTLDNVAAQSAVALTQLPWTRAIHSLIPTPHPRDFMLRAICYRDVTPGIRLSILTKFEKASAEPSKVTALYNRPFPRLRSLLCFIQRSFPLLAGVVLRAPLREYGIGDLEVAMRCASVADGVAGTIKLLHCGGLADWAKERPGQRRD